MEKFKQVSIRIPFHDWVWMKSRAAQQDRSFNDLITDFIKKQKEKSEKKLTKCDSVA